MKFLYKILVLLLAGPVVFIFAKPIKTIPWFRYLFISIHAVFLTYCTVFLFNRPEWRWAEQRSLLKKNNKNAAYEFISNNFLLIDNSFDKMLLPNPEGDESDSTALVLTNRKSLVSFLNLVNEHTNDVDLVVIDMGFSHTSPDDTALESSLLQLYADNKILLSINPNDQDAIRMIKNPAVYGNISEKGKENLFTSHSIYKDGYYSLPYKIYCLMNERTPGHLLFNKELFQERTASGRSSLNINTFFPEFNMTNERIFRGEVNRLGPNVHPDQNKGLETSSRIYFYLSQPLSPGGREEFIDNLRQRKKAGRKNIIFIGAFASAEEDVHQTLYGDLHGTTIILNVLYSLEKKKHTLRFGYIFFLLAGYFILSLILFYKGLGIHFKFPQSWKIEERLFPSIKKKSKQTNNKANKQPDGIVTWFQNLLHFIFDFIFVKELPITLLLIFSIIVQFFFGQWPNILPLLIYMAGVKVSLDYAKKNILKTNV
ncbi:MAG TPA: hypothetical protein VN451_11690 [Chitinophagaceae bacterium]|nr:hypothetical protein [Chitinophagaceae bacterium]